MKNYRRLLLLMSSCILLQSVQLFGQTLKADYQFQGNLNSSVGTIPAMTNLVGMGNGPNTYSVDTVDGFSRQVLNFPLNSGVAVTDLSPILTNNFNFTMVVLFKLGALGGRRRFLDTSGGTLADQGAFLLDGRIEGESLSTLPATAGTYIQIIVIRGGGTIKAYRDGYLRVSETDDSSSLTNGFRFFQDYVNSPVQASGGSIARLRFYDGAMTDDQVAAIDRVPESVSGTMPLLTSSDRFGYPNRFRMNTDGTSQKRLTSGSGIEFFGRFSPDGQKIVYMQRPNPSTPPTIWISNADGSNPIPLTSGTNDQTPSWRPDGQKIIFSRCTPPVCDIYTMNPDGTNVAALTAANTANSEEYPRYSPDGTKIVFACSLATNNLQLCTANADGSNRVQITTVAAPIIHRNPDISPDGTKIMCIRGTDASTNRITIMNFDGSNVSQLSQSNGVDTPIWSPNGLQIAYSRKSIGSTGELHISNADGSSETRITFNSMDDTLSDWYRPQVATRRVPFDFDGDGKSDVSVYRPSNGLWYLDRSQAGGFVLQLGNATDKIAPADFDGDGKADIAVYRQATGTWYLYNSATGTYLTTGFGIAEDLPAPGDYDGDGKADIAVYRPSTGTWWLNRSTAGLIAIQFGLTGDIPVPGDFDGDGKADLVVFRPSNGIWYMQRSTAGGFAIQFGNSTDKIAPADYDGDGKMDVGIYRPSQGTWYSYNSSNGSYPVTVFGLSTDVPVPGDYDGDGKADIAIFRPSNGQWWLNRTTSGLTVVQFGSNGDKPTQNAFGN